MKETPFLAVGNGELDNNPDVPEQYKCHRCSGVHPVHYGKKLLKDGTKVPSKMLAFIKCKGKPYLIGLNGKLLRSE